MTTPETQTNTKKEKKVVKLSPLQGCLLLAVMTMVFGGSFVFLTLRNAERINGTVSGDGVALEAWGCTSEPVSSELTVLLRDDPPKSGVHLGKRALILRDESVRPESQRERDVQQLTLKYRDENGQTSLVNCDSQEQSLKIKTTRRVSGPQARRQVEYWNGSLSADCLSEALGSVHIDLEMENCR